MRSRETLATGWKRVTVLERPKGKRAQLTLSAGCASAQALRAALELGGTDGNEEPVEAAEHRVKKAEHLRGVILATRVRGARGAVVQRTDWPRRGAARLIAPRLVGGGLGFS